MGLGAEALGREGKDCGGDERDLSSGGGRGIVPYEIQGYKLD